MENNNNPDDKTLLAAYKYVDSMIRKSNSLSDSAPLWHGWALREAFLAGVSYSKENKKEETCLNCKEPQNDECNNCGKPMGNITFTHCDDCWRELYPSTINIDEFIKKEAGDDEIYAHSLKKMFDFFKGIDRFGLTQHQKEAKEIYRLKGNSPDSTARCVIINELIKSNLNIT